MLTTFAPIASAVGVRRSLTLPESKTRSVGHALARVRVEPARVESNAGSSGQRHGGPGWTDSSGGEMGYGCPGGTLPGMDPDRGDGAVVNVGSPADLDFTIEVLQRNTKTEVAVSAVSSGGESALSAITAVTTPA